jgi:hypothetical protein
VSGLPENGRKEMARRSKTVSMDVNSRKRKSSSTILSEDLTINYHEFLMIYDAELVLLSQT